MRDQPLVNHARALCVWLCVSLCVGVAACGPEGDGGGAGDNNNGGPEEDAGNNGAEDMAPDEEEPDEPDMPDVPEEGEVVTCPQMPGLTGDSCEATPGGAAILLRGTVLGPLAVYEGGQVLVDEVGEIVCVGCDCDARAEASGATEVNCGANIISPGLINTHEHITFAQNSPGSWGEERFDHRHDWRIGLRGHSEVPARGQASDAEIAWGELRHVMSGATSVAGSGDTMGFLRNVDRDDLGGRTSLATFPLGDTGGDLLDNGCGYPRKPSERDLNAGAYVPHVAEGIDRFARNEFLCLSSGMNGGVDVAEENATFIHGVGLLPEDGALLAEEGTAISWAPRSNISLYGNTAPVTMLDNQGVLIALGTDWTPSGSMNMLRELQCADLLNQTYYGGHFSDRDLWKMATSNAAEALGVQDLVGSLTPGRLADIAVYTAKGGESPYRDILDGGVGDTVLVLRGGEPLYGATEVVGALVGGDRCDALGDVCGASRSVCTQREIGMSFMALAQQNSGSYDLFFCGPPRDEPTCVPSRPDEYSGDAGGGDRDGDGLGDGQDNCPAVFNPVRPLDDGAQGDADADGVGDACDPCPLEANTERCDAPDPSDADLDGVQNVMDNCPNASNADQADGDRDGKGDACDLCPEEPNPGAAGCAVSIRAIKRGDAPQGSAVQIEGIVTGVTWPRFFVQEAGDPQYAGVFVFINNIRDVETEVTGLAVGDRVRVNGAVGAFFGQTQVTDVVSLERLEANAQPPSPAQVTPAQVGAGAGAAPYEGSLVRVRGVVTGTNFAPGPGDDAPSNEIELDNALRVNDYLYLINPPLAQGDEVEITGVLRFANDRYKVEPRGEADVVVLDGAPPTLTGISPANAQVALDGRLSITVSLSRNAPEGGVTVQLANSNPTRLQAPASVAIPGGAREGRFEVVGLEVGPNPVILTATLDGGAGQVARVTVVEEITIPDTGLVISEVLYNPDGGDSGKEWVELFNGTTATIDLSGYSLGSGGANYTTSTVQLAGMIPPGGCFVVGGPTSEAAIGSPTYDQVFDFSPDFQNSGADADGVALFAVPAAQVQAGTVPLDAVIYGGANTSGLLDETGAAGMPDVGDAGSGNSIERTGAGWRVQEGPTPNNCGALQ
jgi:cytosine/adenosine deaminase-related metal-dependent hydrolase